jgi:hypothetical protein
MEYLHLVHYQSPITIAISTANDLEELGAKLRELRTAESCVICVVCAIGWTDSIDNVKQKWLKFVEDNAPSMPVMIVCNDKREMPSDLSADDVLNEFDGIDAIHKVSIISIDH